MKKLQYVISILIAAAMTACAPGFQADLKDPGQIVGEPVRYFPIATAMVNVSSFGDIAAMKQPKKNLMNLVIPMALADVAQGSATINVTYSNPGATAFTINTASLGNAITVSGTDLNLGTIALASLDDNSLRVCTGVGAPANKCNRLYIRVFTLGTATGGITGTAGFINTAGTYGIPVFAGSVPTALGFNASALAASVTNAATVYTYTIGGGMNRVRLSDLTNTPFPIKADLSNAGSGPYEMNLVVQYALGYQ